ncbi:MAG TPA: response regulator [Rhizomicrobium sp.]|jgi:DNA-binding response OmpR family regulator|nr:response regulator [Rhizomicrobium sp.]
MSAVDQAFDSALASLRQRYVSGLGASIAELKKFAVLCDFDEINSEIVAAIAKVAHKLNGTGETLGFPEISTAALGLERILESDTPPGGAAAAARALARACEFATGVPPATTIPEKIASPELPPEIDADSRSAIPHFVVIQSDPGLAKLVADACAKRASVTNLAACADAMGLLNDARADLLLLDLDNAGCAPDSVIALRRKAHELNIPIVAVASHRRSAAILHALTDGEIECLLKPVDAATLYKKLFEILERQRRLALLCDDDPVIREVLKPRFEARGFQVQLAKDGDELLALAGRIRPSIIVLDRTMPGLDGIEVLKMLKARSETHRIPVVMLTSRFQPQEITEGLRSGAAAYLAKPFSPDQVLAKCLEVLGMTRPQRA